METITYDDFGNTVDMIGGLIIGIDIIASAAGKKVMENAAYGMGNIVKAVGNSITNTVKKIADAISKPKPKVKTNEGNSGGRVVPRQPDAPAILVHEPCPPLPELSLHDLPSVVQDLVEKYVLVNWVEYVLKNAKRNKRYKNRKPVHHAVPQKARDDILSEARQLMNINYPNPPKGVETPLNKIQLSAITHAPLYTNFYYVSIQRNFAMKDEGKTAMTDIKLKTYR